MPCLLDTNILSELRRGSRCDIRVREWAHATRSDQHCISVLSIGEIRRGIEILRRKSPDQCHAFESWLEVLQTEYVANLLPVTESICEKWGRMSAEQTLPVIDGLLAATAQVHGLTIATRNIADFQNSGASLVNPFESL